MSNLPENSIYQRAINIFNSNTNRPIVQKKKDICLVDEINKLKLANLRLKKLDDYLYYTEYYDWDYDKAQDYIEKFAPKKFGCSSIRKGNLYGRNFDWHYDEGVDFVVKTLPTKGRHGSIGVGRVHGALTKDEVSTFEWNDIYDVLPFSVHDGKNDAGVYCNVNVVPSGDKGFTTGTNPGAERMCAVMLPRLVLDYADSALDAVELIQNYDIWAREIDGEMVEIHMMIVDATSTYVVEFVNNTVMIFSDQDDDYEDIPNSKAIMTNFYYAGWNGEIVTGFNTESGIDPEDTTLSPHADGLERYSILSAAYENIEDEEDLLAAMTSVLYSNAYKQTTNPFWYSEFLGDYTEAGLSDYTVCDPATKIQPIADYEIDIFNHRVRDGKTWHTTHTCLYDISTGTMKVYSQENMEKVFVFE